MGASHWVEKLAADQVWLDAVADFVQPKVRDLFTAGGESGQSVKNLLHGTWLGHPLHPALTDIPIGAWTIGVGFDAIELLGRNRDMGLVADATIGVGTLSAVAAAAAGLTDWSDINGKPRRVGVAHALLNTVALLFFVRSLMLRCSGNRGGGRLMAGLGLNVATISALLGGELVYGHRIGVSHAADEELPIDFVPVLAEVDLAENTPRRVQAGTTPVLLVRREGRIFAIGDRCSHLGGPLSEGRLENTSIVCPWHASRFSLEDGRVLDGPATFPEPCFETRIRDGQIEVRSVQAELNAA